MISLFKQQMKLDLNKLGVKYMKGGNIFIISPCLYQEYDTILGFQFSFHHVHVPERKQKDLLLDMSIISICLISGME